MIRSKQNHFGTDIKVPIISVDAQVASRKTGRLVDNLVHDDFLISENGVRREVYAWDHLPKPLHLLVLVDPESANTPGRVINDRFRDFRSAVLNRLDPGDEMGIIALGRTPIVLEGFTNNKELLSAALDRISSNNVRSGLALEERLSIGLDKAAKQMQEVKDPARSIIVLISALPENRANEPILPEALATALIKSKSLFFCECSQRIGPGTSQSNEYSLDRVSITRLVELSGGEFLDGDWKSFLDRVRVRYQVIYIPVTQNHEGELVRIRLEVRARPGRVTDDLVLSYPRFAVIPSPKRSGK